MKIQTNYIERTNQYNEKYRISYNSWGHPEAKRVLFCVHGLNRNSRDFDFIAEHMLSNDYYIIAPDLPGRGNSTYLGDYRGYSLESNIYDLLALIDLLELRNIDFLGVSLGGVLGMLLASLPHKPISKLILSDIGAEVESTGIGRIISYSIEQPDFATFAGGCDYLRSLSAGDGIFDEKIWQHMFINSLQRNFLKRWELKRDLKLAKSLIEGVSSGGNIKFWHEWQQISCACLIIHGQKSDLLTAATLNKMHETNPRLEVLAVADAGHAPYLYRKEHLDRIKQFLLAN